MRSKIPNLRHLDIALHVCKTHGFSSVSKIVNLSPSAITQAMRGLETSIGAQIFDRSQSGAFPNALGKIYLDRISRAFDALGAAENALDKGRAAFSLKSRVTASQLRAIIAVVQSGSYNQAARRLGLSQPSVYKAAHSVEVLYNTDLFRPSPSGVEATQKAREFSRHASVALSEIERGQEEVMEYQGRISGRLAIGALPLICARVLPDAINKLLQIYPDADVKVIAGVYSDLLDSLRHGDHDILIGALRHPAPAKDVQQTDLFEDALSIIVGKGHPILSIPKPGLNDLAKLDWVVPHKNTPTRHCFERFFSDMKEQRPTRIIETSSLLFIRTILQNSDRATLLSVHQAHYEIERGDLVVVKFVLAGSRRTIGVTTRHHWKPTRLQEKFLKLLHEEARAL
ncbi:MAG: LysR family transcriptional regulator [Robiginitomaculum sp.]|nr:MAG: LysR family transcriptional regulator [Robiginitomaculum sp.]